jgi:hypothetical protein
VPVQVRPSALTTSSTYNLLIVLPILATIHIEGEAFLVPIHMLVVDQRGEAAHVRCDGEGTQDTP